jgi:hypothetical protein
MRTVRALAAFIGIAMVAMTSIAPAAQAETAYRYWTYWQGNAGSWQFATQGSATSNPADGAVEGWRFAISGATGGIEAQPSLNPLTAFTDLCGSTPPIGGKKRIALIVDPGYASEAPEGEEPISAVSTCVVANADASGYDILRSQLPVRVEGGLVCGIGGYPAVECTPVIEVNEEAARPPGKAVDERPSKDALNSFGSISLTVLVVIFGIGLAIALWWRRK